MRWTFMAIAILTTGCSFRGMAYVEGNLTRLEAPTSAAMGQPIRVHAHVTFDERYANPALNIHVPLDGSPTIGVEAVADWQEPPMGWGVLERLPFATEVDLDGSVSFDRPGTYTLTARALPPVTVQVGP